MRTRTTRAPHRSMLCADTFAVEQQLCAANAVLREIVHSIHVRARTPHACMRACMLILRSGTAYVATSAQGSLPILHGTLNDSSIPYRIPLAFRVIEHPMVSLYATRMRSSRVCMFAELHEAWQAERTSTDNQTSRKEISTFKFTIQIHGLN